MKEKRKSDRRGGDVVTKEGQFPGERRRSSTHRGLPNPTWKNKTKKANYDDSRGEKTMVAGKTDIQKAYKQ